MASTALRVVTPFLLANAAATIYTSTNIRTQIVAFTLTNTTAGAVTATVRLVESGGTAAAGNTVLSATSINAGESLVVAAAIGHMLNSGDFISAHASAATSITCHISGTQFT